MAVICLCDAGQNAIWGVPIYDDFWVEIGLEKGKRFCHVHILCLLKVSLLKQIKEVYYAVA